MFSALTGTSFKGMHKPECWGAFLASISKGHRSLTRMHQEDDIGVSRRTLWRWRLVFMQAMAAGDEKPLAGVIEADETYFADSFKGSRG